MADLPELALLRVFVLLDTRQLLRVRAVCRRWRDLAQDPAVWRHRELLRTSGAHWYSVIHDLGLLRAVLSAASRVRAVELWSDFTLMHPGYVASRSGADADTGSDATAVALNHLAASTACAAQRLILHIPDVPRAAPILQRQASLGHLEEVELLLFCEWPAAERDMVEFMLSLANIRAKSLKITTRLMSKVQPQQQRRDTKASSEFLLRAVLENPPSASLRTLHCRLPLTHMTIGLYRALLVAHGSSLEEVRFTSYSPRKSEPLFDGFPDLPNLRCVEQCPPPEDMSTLLRCASLQSVHLTFKHREGPEEEQMKNCVDSVVLFLRKATWLKKLTLDVYHDPALQDIVSASGFSGLSELESLSFRQGTGGPSEAAELHVCSLAASLPRLPHLRCLHLTSPSPRPVLDAISCGRAPGLETLTLGRGATCPNSWSQPGCVLVEALRWNPRLHVQVEYSCMCMKAATDLLLRENPSYMCPLRLGLYSHPEEESCALHVQEKLLLWVRVETDVPSPVTLPEKVQCRRKCSFC